MRVIIAYDGSERSDAALDDLHRAGLGDDVDAEVVYVAETWIPPADAFSGPSIFEMAMRDVALQGRNTLARATQQAQRAAERLRSQFPGWRITSRAEPGSPALCLIERAERWPADLLVVGAQGHAVIERLALGSVSLRVLTHLRCAVRVARPPRAASGRLRIAVGVDGSADAEAALSAVLSRAWPAETETRVITVLDHRVLTVPAGVELMPGNPATSASQAIANAAAGMLRQAGLNTSAVTMNGDPKVVLVGAARDWQANCIFVGARGLTRVKRFLLGSVSTSVAMHAPCSVEVIHPKDGA